MEIQVSGFAGETVVSWACMGPAKVLKYLKRLYMLVQTYVVNKINLLNY